MPVGGPRCYICTVDIVFRWRMWGRLLVTGLILITDSYWLPISKSFLIDPRWKMYIYLKQLAQACSGRPAASESKSKEKWPARSNAATPHSHSSSPLLHPHYKY